MQVIWFPTLFSPALGDRAPWVFLVGRMRGMRQLFPSAEKRKWSYFYKLLQFNVYIDFVFDIFFERRVLIQVSTALHLGFSSWLDSRRETCLGGKKKIIVWGIGILMAANFSLFRSAILLKPISYFITAFLAFLKINDRFLWCPTSQMHPEGSPIDSPTENDKLQENSVLKSDQARGTESCKHIWEKVLSNWRTGWTSSFHVCLYIMNTSTLSAVAGFICIVMRTMKQFTSALIYSSCIQNFLVLV